MLLLLASLLASLPHFPSFGCLGRVVFTMPCPSFGLCWWDLLVSREQNFPYETLQVWGTPVCSGGALLPPHCPKSAVRPVVALVLLWCLIKGGVRSSPRWVSQRNRLHWQQWWDNRTEHGVTRSPATAGPRTPQWPSLPPSCSSRGLRSPVLKD